MSNNKDAAIGSSSNVSLVDPGSISIVDRKLQLLMEKGSKTRQLEKKRGTFLGGEGKCTGVLRNTTRKSDHKRTKLREIDHRHSQPQLTQLQSLETVQGEKVQYQWTTTEIHQSTEYQRVEPIRIESQWTELQQAQTQWVELQKVEVEPQWSECVLIEPPQATPVLLNPVETAQAQYAEIQEVTEVRVVKKIRIYEEIIEEIEHN